MRWLFPDPADHEENASRRAVEMRIGLWWEAFADNLPRIRGAFDDESDFDVAAFMRERLEHVDERLGWEFGPALEGDGDRLVITPERRLFLRPLADAVLRRAPEVEGWEFYHGRPAESAEGALAAVEAETDRELGRCKVSTSVDEMNRVELKFYLPDAQDRELAGVQAAIATEALLGEEAYLRWIGRIDVVEREQGDLWVPFDVLQQHVFGQVAGLDAKLYATPLHSNVDRLQWSLWRLSPPQKDEYPRQQDLIMGSSALDSMSACAQLGRSFDSRRYSRVGETFTFLKFDGEGRKVAARMEERKRVEKAVGDALVNALLGCVVGTGTGKKYSYLDLALTDVAASIPIIRDRMREAGVAQRSWMLFHDAHLSDEWVGIHDETPPPPK